MSGHEPRPLEGWAVRSRAGAIGLALFVGTLVCGVVGTGLYYEGHVEPLTRPNPSHFPAPTLETIETAPGDTAEPHSPAPPLGIDTAMRSVAAGGDTLWNAGGGNGAAQ